MVCVCPECGKEFDQPPSDVAAGRKHCSNACRGKASRKRITKACERCGRDFESRIARGRKYCSAECSSVARKTGRSMVALPCVTCGKLKVVHQHYAGKFAGKVCCSVACRAARLRKKIVARCDHCGGEYSVLPVQREKFGRRYCSMKCSAEARKKGEMKTCPVCKGEFWSQAHRKQTNRGTFCSIRCYRVGSMTAPERKVKEWLDAKSIPYESQKKFRIGYVDFFLSEIKTVIEVDGDYWHSLERQITKDRVRDAYLTKIGIRVVRVREGRVNEDIDSAMECLTG